MRTGREPFEGLRPKEIPPGLRERVLLASASAPGPAGSNLVDRIWESRRVRVVAAAAAAILVIANVGMMSALDRRDVASGAGMSPESPSLATISFDGLTLQFTDERTSYEHWAELLRAIELPASTEAGRRFEKRRIG